jgi:hypothetical protein
MKLLIGDCLEELKKLEDNSVDSLITDPPAGISFMGKEWDEDKGGRKQWIAWMSSVMKEALRVLKPGAHGLVWAIPRTSHWTATALEDAGFEVRDVVTHIFGSGFPKSLDISKAIDKAAGAQGEPIGKNPAYRERQLEHDAQWKTAMRPEYKYGPSTPEAKQWLGFGTALKPASEHWILVRKPIAEKTVAANVLAHGVGGINIDACRVGNDTSRGDRYKGKPPGGGISNATYSDMPRTEVWNVPPGRFPANLVLSHNDDCVELGTKTIKTNSGSSNIKQKDANSLMGLNGGVSTSGYGREQTVAAFECTPGCAVAALDKQSLAGGMHSAGKANTLKENKTQGNIFRNSNDVTRIGDSGGASRFFYCAKASKSDKGSDNTHPTVKASKLMSYLIKLITPPNGIVLDPFMGSGSTGVAALREGFQFIGIEQDSGYAYIAQTRMENV